jgi:spore germination protein YaaH
MLITSPQPSLESLGKYYEKVKITFRTLTVRSLFEKKHIILLKMALKNKLQLINGEQGIQGVAYWILGQVQVIFFQ